MTDEEITRLRTLAQADAAARHRAMQWHADHRLTNQDDDEVHHTTEALRARLDGFVILELLDRQREAPSAEPVAKVVLTETLGLPCLQWLDLSRQFDFKGGEMLYTTPPDHREAMQQALEALEERYIGALRDNAIDALRKALEEK
jgi:hypothetical protein